MGVKKRCPTRDLSVKKCSTGTKEERETKETKEDKEIDEERHA